MASDTPTNGTTSSGGSDSSGTTNGTTSSGGSDSSGTTDGTTDGTTPDGSSGSLTSPTGMSIDGLTSGLTQIKDNGPADVKLSTDTKNQYLALIGGFHDELMAQRRKMDAISPLGDPGTLGSANETKNFLEGNVHDLGGITDTTDKYLNYLDEFHDALMKAASRMIQSG
jgi:hypothetical protein